MASIMSVKAAKDSQFVDRYDLVLLATMLLVFLLISTTASYAQKTDSETTAQQAMVMCGPEVKEEVAKALGEVEQANESDKLALQAELYEKYAYCAKDVAVPDSFLIAARQCGARVSNLGNLYYEEMSCCGYDPQRRQFACPVKIKQTFGFGWAPLPGSREYSTVSPITMVIWFRSR